MESNRRKGQDSSRTAVVVLGVAVAVIAEGGGAAEDIILKFTASCI
jgi:hypothetical protein